jgi:hypothetical protein
MMAFSDDHIALAAEYALGTLDADERAQVETMMSADKDFTVIVRAWEHKLGALNQMVGSVEPRPELWDKIRTAVGHSEPQAPLMLPEPPAPLVAASVEELAAVLDNANVVRLTANARRWRRVASFTSAIAAALVAMIGVGLVVPDLLPDRMRLRPQTQVVESRTPPAPAPSAQYVAVLQREADRPRSFSRLTEQPGVSRFARSALLPSPARASNSG